MGSKSDAYRAIPSVSDVVSPAYLKRHPKYVGVGLGVVAVAILLLQSNMAPAPDYRPRPELMGTETMRLWHEEHEAQVFTSKAAGATGDASLVFLGDSITQGWRYGAFSTRDPTLNGKGKPEEEKLFRTSFTNPFSDESMPLIWAIGGDKVLDLSWRLEHGLTQVGVNPAALVLLIGTNDIKDPAKASGKKVADAVLKTVVNRLRLSWPRAQVVLLGLLPRAPREFPITSDSEAWDAGNVYFKPIMDINKRLEKGAAMDGQVTYVDCGAGFLSEDGTRLLRSKMGDYLHPSLEGYRVLADCLKPVLNPFLAASNI